ncbi:hypothetical protein J3B02_000165 [Coemansia erecta]|nr:hypothetical protein J3B02_000165 [Coemansia erecta]
MSLADLYRDEESELEESEEDEFVPGGSEDDGSDGGSEAEEEKEEENGDSENDGTEQAGAADASEQQKRRIDDIWQEMNAPAGQRAAKQARVEEKEPESDKKDQDQASEEVVAPLQQPLQQPLSLADSEGLRKGGPKRRVSKFSKMAEMVEQRRGKRENTLDRARKEWAGFVDKEGIREDLDKANKDG